ncbi:hypothetical protein MIZ03_4086 [Rhodoferax lithotrophicus]|uniref:Uncharacterized protein n=2 Tax=Rhodoferax lithotrophicus TaxID=2798804 RepID=A0ABM7MSL6_9BURK|nr:hypothetical protein MIZ03_4086 [Rhodoferax sp. MIZ03]
MQQRMEPMKNTANTPTLPDYPAQSQLTAHQQEQQESLTTQYRTAILEKLSKAPVENEIRDFLIQVWTPILAAHAVRQGPEHPATLKFKQAAVELINIHTALLRRAERKQAMGQAPKLVEKLRQGMSWMGLSPEEQDRHIQSIGSNLTDAFLTEHPVVASNPLSTERRSGHRARQASIKPKVHHTPVDGLLVGDENTDFDWHLWETALNDQTATPANPDQQYAPALIPPASQDTPTNLPDFWGNYLGHKL